MGRCAHRRILPLELLLVGDVDHPVADDEEGERGREENARRPVDVRHAVYVALDPLAVLAAAVRGLALTALPACERMRKKIYIYIKEEEKRDI